ncbi:MAG TPA: hypothetical protein VK869_05750 [Rubrobacteraceae bacterium]|nr:hypothetical protein [Rubrobacteraceae bacterium]
MTASLLTTLTIVVLTSLSAAATPVAARESNACDRYECAEALDPSESKDPAIEQSLDDVPSPSVESEISTGRRIGAEGLEKERSEISPVSVSPRAEDSASETSNKESVGPQEYYGNEKTGEAATGENTNRPLPAYPSSEEACEGSRCGLPDVEKHLRCAVYQTASGKEVYGCTDPRTSDGKDCYEITFYTITGKPYSHLDTCSGEKPYAPPEPPKGEFNYFDPPATPYSAPDWTGHGVDQCYFDQEGEWVEPQKGVWDWHCGLESLPKSWGCEVFFDTAYGTVRGCRKGIEAYGEDRICSRPVHLYDEAGREIDAVPSCPKVRSEKCGANQCGAPVPFDWTCRREYWSFGELYGGETRTLRRCASPEFYEYVNEERPPCKRRNAKLISALYDERGEKIDGMSCLPGGSGGDLGEWAGLEAKQADDTLKGTKRRPTTDSSDDAEPLTDSEERSEHPGSPSAPDAPVTVPGIGESGPAELDFYAAAGSAGGSGATPVADGGQPGLEFADHTLVPSRPTSGDQTSPKNEEGVSEKGQRERLVLDLPGTIEAASASAIFAAGKREDPGYNALSESRIGGTGGAISERKDIQRPEESISDKGGQRKTASSSVLNSAAELEGSFPGDGDRAGAKSTSGTGANGVGQGDWWGSLVPLSGLAAAVGMFVLRQRLFA